MRFGCGVLCTGLLLSAQGSAAIFSVGPGGTHPSLQAAVDAAFSNPGIDELRLREGVLSGTAVINGDLLGNDLVVSGGWAADYLSRGDGQTILDAGGAGAVLRGHLSGGSVQLLQLTLRGGRTASQAAGLSLNLSGNVTVLAGQLVIEAAVVDGSSAGGVGINARDDSQFGLFDAVIRDCRNGDLPAGGAAAAGINVIAQDRSQVLLDTVDVYHNLAQATASTQGVGLHLQGSQEALLRFRGGRVHDNAAGAPNAVAAGISVSLSGSAAATLSQLELYQNLAPAAPPTVPQLALSSTDSGVIRLHSSLLRDAPLRALSVSSSAALALVHAHNLTVVAHAERGFALFGNTAAITLHNSIVQGNGLPSTLEAGSGDHNLGTDLGLANAVFAGVANWRLAEGSPGVDAGTAAVPLGLTTTDLDGTERWQGPAVDIGAYEREVPLFASGFEGMP